MLPVVKQILVLFGFTKYQMIIAIICLVVLLGSFLGGLLRSIMMASGGPLKPLKTTQTMGFRLVILAEAMLLIFAFYYHAILIQTIDVSHVIYWVFALLSAPVLAFMGSQITYLVFQKKIEENYDKYRKIQVALKARKKKAAEAAAKAKAAERRDRARMDGTKRFTPHS